MPEFFTHFNRPPKGGITFTQPSKTEQSHKDDYDLNRLIKRATSNGGILGTADQIRDVYFDDFSVVGQQLENHLQLLAAEEHFMSLPSATRAEFRNSPKELLAAFADPRQHDRLIKFGLLRKPEPIQPAQPLEPAQPVQPAQPLEPAQPVE